MAGLGARAAFPVPRRGREGLQEIPHPEGECRLLGHLDSEKKKNNKKQGKKRVYLQIYIFIYIYMLIYMYVIMLSHGETKWIGYSLDVLKLDFM